MTEREAWVALASTPGVGDVTFSRLLAALRQRHRRPWRRVARMPAAPCRSAPRRATGDADSDRGLAQGHPGGSAGDPGRTAAPDARARRLAADARSMRPIRRASTPSRSRRWCSTASGAQATCAAIPGGGRGHPATHRPAGVTWPPASGRAWPKPAPSSSPGWPWASTAPLTWRPLEAGGYTVAVVGGGLDEPGPAPHRRLARRIAEHGAVVGELPPGVRPTRGTFPRRNRIISALATRHHRGRGTSTQRCAHHRTPCARAGTPLLVAPGRPLDPRVAGNLALLRESPARPLVGLDEMIADLGTRAHAAQDRHQPDPTRRHSSPPTPHSRCSSRRSVRVARALAGGPQSVDGLCRATGLDAGVVAASPDHAAVAWLGAGARGHPAARRTIARVAR